MRIWTDLSLGEKIVVRRQELDRLLAEQHPGLAGTTPTPTAPAYLSAALQTTWTDIAEKCRRARIGQLSFVVLLWSDAAMRDALNAEALARAQTRTFREPGVPDPGPPVEGENVAGLT